MALLARGEPDAVDKGPLDKLWDTLIRPARITIVAMELKRPLNRFCLIQPITPTLVAGGLISSIVVLIDRYRSMIAIFLLYQFI